jgi:RHS repeat-associated protein
LRFPGQYYDQESNNYYNYFRDYDSATGRYVQEDPIGLYGGFNTYIYVHDNPVKYIDPTGEILPAAAAGYVRCVVTCMAVTAAMDAATGSCDFKNSGKDCAVDCLLPWNWFKFGKKIGMRSGGGKNAKHKNQDAREAARKKWEEAKRKVEQAKRDGLSKKERRPLERERDHWKRKYDETGENHSQKPKRNG